MKTIKIVRDEFAPESAWEVHEAEHPLLLLTEKLGSWPPHARLYHGAIAAENDVTPADDADLEALGQAPGPFIAVLHSGEPASLSSLIVALVVGVAGAVVGLLLRPSLPGNEQAPSSNNALGNRTNQPRPNARIPDIFGSIEAVPDLIGVPLRLFADSKEYELAPLCIGRGEYEIDAADVLDGGTPVSQIEGASIEIYGPGTSPNLFDSPQLTIGEAIGTAIVTVSKIDGVNGQTLLPPNYRSYTSPSAGTTCLRFRYPNFIISTDVDELNMTKFAEAGNKCVITGSTSTDLGHTANLDNDLAHPYTVTSVDNGAQIQLTSPATIDADWNTVDLMTSHQTPVLHDCTIDFSGLATKAVGSFFIDVPEATGGVLNFVALGGQYKTDGNNSFAVNIEVDIGIRPADAFGAPTGLEIVYTVTVPGSSVDRSQRGYSAIVALPGRCLIRCTRKTPTDYIFEGTVSDELKWRDLFVTAPIGVTDFGNVTTIWAKQSVTQAALGVKERKLTIRNCRRKVAERDGDGFAGTLAASSDAADIICAVARDPYIGRRSDLELNVPQIRSTIAAVKTYFGDDAAGEFGFSFDDDQLSAEDMIQTVAQACFCEAVRRGSKLELVFERATEDSALLFNHRNILPDTPKRTPMFGRVKRYDGVELNYIDGANGDTPATILVPDDGSAENPQKVDMHGVRDGLVAYWHACRLNNKARFQRMTATFTATHEAALTTRLQRIAVADTSAPFDGMSGDVTDQDGLNLSLSQSTRFVDGTDYVIMLQYPDGTVGLIDVVPGDTTKKVVLADPPAQNLSTDIRNVRRAKYWILPDDASDFGRAFLITEKGRADQGTFAITTINYDARYYQQDGVTPS